jgi:hypothetical protein
MASAAAATIRVAGDILLSLSPYSTINHRIPVVNVSENVCLNVSKV